METKFKIGDEVYLVEIGKYEKNISLVKITAVRFTDTGRTIYFFGRTRGVEHSQLFKTWEEALKEIKD